MTQILPVIGFYQRHTSWLEVVSNGRLDLLTNQNKATLLPEVLLMVLLMTKPQLEECKGDGERGSFRSSFKDTSPKLKAVVTNSIKNTKL